MINVKQWMDLPLEVRVKIIKDFNLVRTGKAGIANNKIVSDGYTQNDILKVSLQNLQRLMDSSEENFDVLFDEYKKLIENSFKVIDEFKVITVDMNSLEKHNHTVIEHNRKNLKEKFQKKLVITAEDIAEGIFEDGYTPTPEEIEMFGITIKEDEVFNPNMAPSGDTETYFGTKIKPVTYKPNDKKTNKRK